MGLRNQPASRAAGLGSETAKTNLENWKGQIGQREIVPGAKAAKARATAQLQKSVK